MNAWALPNGDIAVYTGLLAFMKNEAALAAVIGHEIGHVVARHGNERMTQNLAAGVAVQLAAIGLGSSELDPETQQMAVAALGAGATVGILLPFSRQHEYEADRLGVAYMASGGYDPREAVTFWQRFASNATGQKPPEFFSTHPSDANRIAKLNERMSSYLQTYQQTHGSSVLVVLLLNDIADKLSLIG